MLQFIEFYIMAIVYIAGGVLAISAVVAGVEKAFGLNRPR